VTATPLTAPDSSAEPGHLPPRARGGLPGLGHLLELRRDPLALLQRIHDEHGEIGEMNLAGNRVVLLYGAEAQEAFFRAPDEQLDQAAAYPFMKPIFGPGVVFDATPEQRKQAMRNQSLRDKFMRGHAETIAAEVERMTAEWGESGEVDVLDFFSELTLYTSSSALIGKAFRDELGPEYVDLFKDLERGTDALAYVNPYLPLPAFRRRDRARRRLVAKLEAIFERRARDGGTYQDLFQILHGLRDPQGRPRYSGEQITGMFISMMFAGHHTSSVVASWALLDLLMHPEWLARVQAELGGLYADGREVSYQALRDIPLLECCLKETLRLHPPLIILMRKVMHDFHYRQWTIPAGRTVAVATAVSNRMPEHFPDPARYDPARYSPGREEDKQAFAWIPFGGGRHRCVGAAFAMMQLKAIFSILLRRYAFELAQPRDRYGEDHSKMVVAVRQPCRVRYRRREAAGSSVEPQAAARPPERSRPYCVRVDLELCQGHGVCVNESPEVFALDERELRVRLLEERPGEQRRPGVESAVRHCPTRALEIVDEPPADGEA
jgi:sterol 14-demethylase